MEQISPPKEKELPAPDEKLLRSPAFWERQGKIAKWLAVGSIILFLLIFATTLFLKSQKSTITPIQPTQPKINAIEISSDQKSILNADTKKVIFTIEEAKAFLEKSDNPYNPDPANPKYAGDCFGNAVLSNNKYRIVFSTDCLPGDLPEAWIGIYNLPLQTNCPPGAACMPNPPAFQFLISGSGKNFIWSQDDATITYEANSGLSGMNETHTIDSQTGKILNKENNSTTKDYFIQKETLKDSNPKIIAKRITFSIKNYSLDNGVVKITGMDQKINLNEPILPILDLDKETLPPTPITDNSKEKEIKVVFDAVNSKSTTIKNKIPIGDIGWNGEKIKGKFSYQGFWPSELYKTYSTFALGAEAKEVGFTALPVQYNSETGETKIWTIMVFDVEYNLAN